MKEVNPFDLYLINNEGSAVTAIIGTPRSSSLIISFFISRRSLRREGRDALVKSVGGDGKAKKVKYMDTCAAQINKTKLCFCASATLRYMCNKDNVFFFSI